MKIKIYFNKGAFRCFVLYDYITTYVAKNIKRLSDYVTLTDCVTSSDCVLSDGVPLSDTVKSIGCVTSSGGVTLNVDLILSDFKYK
jgi:hypothetical protein